MNKIIEFLKSKKLVIEWTVGYFAFLWFILHFIFKFDMFSLHYWHRFFHATFRGFGGFVFCVIIYSAIPIYLATVSVINRTNTPLITIPFIGKISEFLSKFVPKPESEPEQKTDSEAPKEPEKQNEYPEDLPSELRVPFMRAKQNISFRSNISVYNKIDTPKNVPQPQPEPENFSDILPSDFDISDTIPNEEPDENFVPTFTDINFDEPTSEPETLKNNSTKYFDEKHIEYETYKDFVATEKYLIYEHNDGDFWIMDEDSWFASGKQIESPINELKQIAQHNELIPVLYLQSQNIMDIENTINQIESTGVRVIKSLDELGF